MNKESRNAIERATQRARKLLEDDLIAQLEGTFDVLRSGAVAEAGGAHLSARQRVQRERIVAAVGHKRAAAMSSAAAVADYVRDAAFTTLNRFAALKMLEARELVQQCISQGELSSGYREFCGLAPGVALLPESAGYRLYVESLFDELSTEVKVLFDRRDPAAVLWPRRAAFEALLAVLNEADLAGVWAEDETIGWIYQFFNSREERQAMRDPAKGGSQAPRNSRELAVRNQFFTPRYVVQFLADNTLGRTWLAMMGEATRLPERCEYMVQDGTEIRPRAKKDPRDLKVLDPACGSGHFLLYAFELFISIYEEAWGDPDAAPRAETRRTLRQDYPNRAELHQALPALVIENNLFGVDIDPRAAQIAALALWMRAQRAWNDARMPAGKRPRVGRTHIVVAEPMPGDAELVEAFAGRLDPPLLGELFRRMVAEMQLAGEMGTLLRVEDALATELRHAQEQFVARRKAEVFLPGFERVRPQAELDLSGIDDDRFFQQAEGLLLNALHDFTRVAAGSAGVRRRLFAGDAAQGIALIELLRTRFDVVLMNPPFGQTTTRTYSYIQNVYPGAHNDLFATFVARAADLAPYGLVGAITSRGFLVAPRMEEFRKEYFLPRALLLNDLGLGIMDDAFVESCAYILAGSASDISAFPLVAFDLRNNGKAEQPARTWPSAFTADREALAKLPKARVLYSIPERVFALLQQGSRFEPSVGTAREGMKTFDNFRFLRLRWEVNPNEIGFDSEHHWTFLAKGGAFSFYVGPTNMVLNWRNGGRELQEINMQKNGSTAQVRQASTYWGQNGITYSGRSARGFSARALPSGLIISGRGPAVLSQSGFSNEYLLGWINSRLIRSLIHLQASASYFATGIIKQLPWMSIPASRAKALSAAVESALSASVGAESLREGSPYYVGPIVRTSADAGLAETNTIADRAQAILNEVMAQWDIAVDQAYKVDSLQWAGDVLNEDASVDSDEESDEEESGARPLTEFQYAESVLSYAVGCVFDHWNPLVLECRDETLHQISAFAELPSGGLAAFGRLQTANSPALVDDPGSSSDLVERVDAFLQQLSGGGRGYVDTLVAWVAAPDLRSYFRGVRCRSFYDTHLERYSKNRRRAPIYWQLATFSGHYSLWVYAHRLTRDTFFQAQQDLLGPKLVHEERKLLTLTQEAGPNPPAAQRREIAGQEAFVNELRAMRDEVARVAPLWNPNLNDGVLLSMAPLWRLVPQNRAWQKELKSAWDALSAGKYDWAHLAMYLWPERVVPRCSADRSLAIAHGLEDIFWMQNDNEKWVPRDEPTHPIEELVAERTSTAVKAALASLQNAPSPAVASGRGRRGSKSGNGGAR